VRAREKERERMEGRETAGVPGRDDSALPVSFACNFLKERERERRERGRERAGKKYLGF